MGNMSNYLEEHVLQEYLVDPNVYLALYNSDPTDEDSGNEVDGGAYERQEVTFTNPTQEGGKATIFNNGDITFDIATSDWGEITHIGIRDAAESGNLLYHGELDDAKVIHEGDQFKIVDSDLEINLD